MDIAYKIELTALILSFITLMIIRSYDESEFHPAVAAIILFVFIVSFFVTITGVFYIIWTQ